MTRLGHRGLVGTYREPVPVWPLNIPLLNASFESGKLAPWTTVTGVNPKVIAVGGAPDGGYVLEHVNNTSGVFKQRVDLVQRLGVYATPVLGAVDSGVMVLAAKMWRLHDYGNVGTSGMAAEFFATDGVTLLGTHRPARQLAGWDVFEEYSMPEVLIPAGTRYLDLFLEGNTGSVLGHNWYDKVSLTFGTDPFAYPEVERRPHHRLVFHGSAANDYAALAEVEMFSTPLSETDFTNGSTITFGTQYDGWGHAAVNAFDGSAASFWAGALGANCWLAAQLPGGDRQKAQRIKLTARPDGWFNQAPTSFTYQTSDDGVAWDDEWVVAATGVWAQGETKTFIRP